MNQSTRARERHYQKHGAGDLKPEMVRGASEGAERGFGAAHESVQGAAAASLLARDLRRYPQLS